MLDSAAATQARGLASSTAALLDVAVSPRAAPGAALGASPGRDQRARA